MLPTYFVSCLARKHVTVALGGDGGDEIFAGYDRYRIHAQRQKFSKVPGGVRRFYRESVYPHLPHAIRGRKFLYNVSLPARERYLDMISFLPAFERNVPLLSDDFNNSIAGGRIPQELMFRFFDQAPADDDVSRLQYLDSKTYLVDDILTKVHRMSMLTYLEVRTPLLDHVLVEWVTGLTTKWKLRGTGQKYIFKKLAERVGVPREVLHRPKQGFAIPLGDWMRHELRDLINTVLLERRTMQRGYFHPAGVKRILDEHFQGPRDHSEGIWRLLMFELWHRQFLDVHRPNQVEPIAAAVHPGAPLGSQYLSRSRFKT
jgi:asparagine synthase (glutamine-hydrolysing)